ncbi:MAG: DNA recombination protein RmuC [Planctomycetes bacterium]|nr:DNA recombination protein RmuC [Planctomycetota bacterium]
MPVYLIIILIVIGLLILGLIGYLVITIRSMKSPAGADEAAQPFMLMQQQMENIRKAVNDSLAQNIQQTTQVITGLRQEINSRLQENIQHIQSANQNVGNLMADVKSQFVSLEKASERLLEVGKDISGLQEILSAPKLRGNLSEFLLADLLAQILPQKNYTLQYMFKSRQKVDAVIKLGQYLVPVDAKFPLENFKRLMSLSESEKAAARKQFSRDVKKHIDDIAEKYILPAEGTADFALMFVQAENVYYEIILKDDTDTEMSINDYALSRRVIPVSPNSFYAYLQAIVLGLKGMHIEQSAREICSALQGMRTDFNRLRGDIESLGNTLGTAQKHFQQTEKDLNKIDSKLLSLESPSQLQIPPVAKD